MKLYFRNSKGKLRIVAEPTSDKECNAAIKQFLDISIHVPTRGTTPGTFADGMG